VTIAEQTQQAFFLEREKPVIGASKHDCRANNHSVESHVTIVVLDKFATIQVDEQNSAPPQLFFGQLEWVETPPPTTNPLTHMYVCHLVCICINGRFTVNS